jgi:hypothetical protein
MSYILDALKKLEQKRQQEGTITLLASQGRLPAKSKFGRIWVYVIIIAFVLNAGIIVWWTGPWKQAAKNTPQRTSVLRESKPPSSSPMGAGTRMETEYVGENEPSPAKEAKQPAPDAAGKENPRAPQQSPKSALPPGQAPSAGGKPQAAQTPGVPKKPVAAQKPTPVEQNYSEAPVRPELKPPQDGRVYKVADLPASVSSGLPQMKMSLHYYIAEPKMRFARINDKTLREGEYLSEGLKVDEINASGAVMNYRGWRILLGISNDR